MQRDMKFSTTWGGASAEWEKGCQDTAIRKFFRELRKKSFCLSCEAAKNLSALDAMEWEMRKCGEFS